MFIEHRHVTEPLWASTGQSSTMSYERLASCLVAESQAPDLLFAGREGLLSDHQSQDALLGRAPL